MSQKRGRVEVVVVGSGIAGLTSAYFLKKVGGDQLTVTLLESSDRLGGHSHTITVDDQRIDLGFQVFNTATYPNLVRIYKELCVPYTTSEMSFTVAPHCQPTVKHSADLMLYLRWALSSPISVFKFMRAKSRFHSEGAAAVANPNDWPSTVGEFFKGYPVVFIDIWVRPFTAAVWSIDQGDVEMFDVQSFLLFCRNHGFLSWSTFEWLTLEGGAHAEVAAFKQYFDSNNVTVVTGVKAISWDSPNHTLTTNKDTYHADYMVLACNAPEARRILGDDAPALLKQLSVSTSDVVLHRDVTLMPTDKRLWSSWNVCEGVISYWLKCIQPCRVHQEDLFISLVNLKNPNREPDPNLVLFRGPFFHPNMNETPALKRGLMVVPPRGGVALAGAWLRSGFHEDGALSGIWAARNILSNIDHKLGRQVLVLPVSNPLQGLPQPVWTLSAELSHTSFTSGGHSFSYNLSHYVALNLEFLPRYWFGGFRRDDHWGDPSKELYHEIVELVFERLGFYPAGSIHLITTLRVFGQCMNPISIYICMDDTNQLPCAYVYEVHNFPWYERTVYVIPGAQRVDSFRLEKTLHVSPWHPHPTAMKQHYITTIEWECGTEGSGQPFSSLHIDMHLYNSAEDKLLFSSNYTVSTPVSRVPSPWPAAWSTIGRIMSQGAALTKTRPLYPNLSNPFAPISATTLFFGILFACLVSLISPSSLLVAGISGVLRFYAFDIPMARDFIYGMWAFILVSLLT